MSANNYILEQLIKISGNVGSIYFLAISFTVYMVMFFDKKRYRKIERIDRDLKSGFIKGETRRYLKSEIEKEYVHKSIGIKIEKSLRDKLLLSSYVIKVYYDLKFIKRVAPYLYLLKGDIAIKSISMTLFEVLYYFFAGIFFMLYGFVFVSFSVQEEGLGIFNYIAGIGIGALLTVIGLTLSVKLIDFFCAFYFKCKVNKLSRQL